MPDMWWEEASNGDAPVNAIICGETATGEKIYVGRGTVDGDLIPGKIVPSEHCLIVGNNGSEYTLNTYEVLVGKDVEKFEWVAASDGTVPSGAVVGGKSASTGEELFVARGSVPSEDNGRTFGGKLHPSHGCLYYTDNGREYSCRDYEVLCEKSSFCTIL